MIAGLSLFSGYGGLDLALRNYVKTIGYVEIEEYAQKIIAYRMAEGSLNRAPIYSDVKNVRGSAGICDIIFGGFPCQDISVAGLGKGLAGERSGLFYEIVRLTKEIGPSFVFLENVPAIRTRGLREVVTAFAKMGYDCRWTCVSASSVGAPHKRERWFLLAHANRELLRIERTWSQRGEAEIKTKPQLNGISGALADTDSPRKLSKQTTRIISPVGTINSSKFERSDWWTTEPNVGRVANGVAFRVDRLKALGNGVVPLQARTAFEKLMGLSK